MKVFLRLSKFFLPSRTKIWFNTPASDPAHAVARVVCLRASCFENQTEQMGEGRDRTRSGGDASVAAAAGG